MRNRVVAAASAATLALLVWAGGIALAQSESSVQIREVDPSAFPVVSLTISIAGETAASPGTILITEDGKALPTPSVRSFSEGGGRVQVVLAIDTSGSMQGQPFASAIDAARAFLRGASSDVAVGILAFSDRPRILQAITTDHEASLAKLGSLQAAGETSLYDAMVSASRMFSGEAQRNMILLSDGGDTVSDAGLSQAAAAAKRSKATVFAVGLRTEETDFGALRTLTRGTDGRVISADEADLTQVYEDILQGLSQQFVVTYESESQPGETAEVTVTTAQGSDTIAVESPGAPPTTAPPIQREQPSGPQLFDSEWAIAGVLAVTFLAAFVLLMTLLEPGIRSRREREIRRRVGVQTPRETRNSEDAGLSTWLPTLVAAGDRLADAGGLTLALETRLERAGLSLTPGEVVTGSTIMTFVLGIIGGLLFKSPILGLVFAGVGALSPFAYLAYATRKRMQKLHAQLPDILMILASSLRAGHSFLQAIDTVSKEAGDPGAKEFARVVAEIRLGRPVDEAMNALAERVGSDDFRWAVLAINIQREVGGNLAEVLDTVAETVREREQVRRQVDVLSIEGKLSMYILIGLPIAIGLYIFRVNRDYISLLFTSSTGLTMFIGGAVLMVAGYVWMRKIVKIDV